MDAKDERALVDGSTQQNVVPNRLAVSGPSPSTIDGDHEADGETMIMSILAKNATSVPPRSLPPIVLLFVGITLEILFGYVNQTNNGITNTINKNKNELGCDLCKILNVNINVDCNGPLRPQQTLAPPQPLIFSKFIVTIFCVFVNEINTKINEIRMKTKMNWNVNVIL